ncbi:hypothetical protein K469DRAFT_601024, partial [Zopfia rhizophila CBS 207.26]
PRLGSKKSRNGCKHCKARRVKCDEQMPCANCSKYGVECSLLTAPIPFNTNAQASMNYEPVTGTESETPSQASTQASPDTQSSISVTPSPSHLPGIGYAPSPATSGETGGWMADLELMHHYTAHAWNTMPGVDQAKQTWGYGVPQEAFRHNFLMHCILAFSAYHLAYINPSARHKYRLLASTHQTAAITGINRVLPDINAANCHALWAAASLITLNAFADSSSNSLDALVEIFYLLRGMNTILNTSEPLIHTGPFAVILRQATDNPKPPPLVSSFLVELQSFAVGTSESSPAVSRAAVDLRDSLQFGIDHSGYPTMRAVMLWPVKLDAEFIEAIKVGQDAATGELLARYLQILGYAGAEWWFLAGWQNISLDS